MVVCCLFSFASKLYRKPHMAFSGAISTDNRSCYSWNLIQIKCMHDAPPFCEWHDHYTRAALFQQVSTCAWSTWCPHCPWIVLQIQDTIYSGRQCCIRTHNTTKCCTKHAAIIRSRQCEAGTCRLSEKVASSMGSDNVNMMQWVLTVSYKQNWFLWMMELSQDLYR